MPPQPSSKQFFGIAKEAVKGTPEAIPTTYPPVRVVKGGRAKTKLSDTSLRGSAVDSYSEADGVFHGTVHVEGDVFADTFGHFLLSVFGEEAISGAGPYDHAFTVLNSGDQQPPGHSVWDGYAVAVRRYPGAQCSSLSLSWEDTGLLVYSADFLTLGDDPIASPTVTSSTIAPHAAWASTCLVGGVAAYPLSGECNLTRNNAGPVHVQDGSQSARHIWVGALSIEGSATLLMETDAYYQQFIDNTQPSLDFNFSIGAGASQSGLRMLMSKATWREPDIDRGDAYVKLKLGFKALGNTTDAGVSGGQSNAKFTLKNARATAY